MPLIIAIGVLLLVGFIFIQYIPFNIFSFWRMDGTLAQWWDTIWPFCAFGLTFGILIILFSRKRKNLTLGQAFVISAWAGIAEEIIWRWALFLFCIPWLRGVNWLLGGFIGEGWGVTVFMYTYIGAPITNFFTFGALSEYLWHSEGWFVGAAMLVANSSFRDGHKYQGFLGYWNSWFVGLGLFIVFFKYGLIAAIIIHFLYDMVLFGLQAFKSSAQGNY